MRPRIIAVVPETYHKHRAAVFLRGVAVTFNLLVVMYIFHQVSARSELFRCISLNEKFRVELPHHAKYGCCPPKIFGCKRSPLSLVCSCFEYGSIHVKDCILVLPTGLI